ncbi:lamin tail domain-containing protein [Naasia sp. SYSU D00057]|uniref:lamin tail domain-containing protein n=1 Tax=Naasia sp. SYSU D00057 TaxID=2817380 RepID=UPI001B306820|nr:lamin tail domain-containing protein [Naasia sp. SYSU D00057]
MPVSRRRRRTPYVLTGSVLAVGLVVGALVAAPLVLPPRATADPDGVVISEINYHSPDFDDPGLDDSLGDFVEVTNTSSAAVDMSGWTFSSGIRGRIPDGTVLEPDARFVAAKDAKQFRAIHGVAPDFVYDGHLSNGGETITLSTADPESASDATTVDTVTYDDAPGSGWAPSADGDGPTLELRDLSSDNALPESWGASEIAGGTPGAPNSNRNTPAPDAVTGVTATPQRPSADQDIVVTAELPVGSTADLKYKVMFGPDTAIPFTDAAAGAAEDGLFGATIPRQAAGALVRYRIDAARAGATFSAPAADDSITYRGVVVTDPSYASQLPVIEWFMEDAVYDDLRANHRTDDVQGPAVWSYNGEVIDNVLMNVRGGSSRTLDKNNWKVELPKGHGFDLGGQLPYPLTEFALQNYQYNQPDIAWATVKEAGARGLNILPVRTQRNGQFWSLGRLMETQDGEWREDQGVEDWAIYKGESGAVGATDSPEALEASGWLDKKTRQDEDYTDVWTLGNMVDGPASPEQRAWIYQNVNVPELINYMAINSILRNSDTGPHNWWLARDSEGTQRWEMWHWDLDLTLGRIKPSDTGPFLTPDTDNKFTRAMLAYPEFREMFFRRLRTLADQFYPPGRLEAQWDAISARTLADWQLDSARWNLGAPTRANFDEALAERRSTILGSRELPAPQAADAPVVISEIQHHARALGEDWIELANPGSTAVDVSGWVISGGIDLTIQAGTVIPAGGRILFVEDDVAFRRAFPQATPLVGGQFEGGLSREGEKITVSAGDRVVDEVSYGDGVDDEWPTPANGASLQLDSLTADNADPSNWRTTATRGGTPGSAPRE